MVVGALGALLLAPAAFASESSLSVYGGPGQELVSVQAEGGGGGGGGAPLPSTGLALGILAVTAMVLVGAGAGARRLTDHRS
jgi:hypothetical protein